MEYTTGIDNHRAIHITDKVDIRRYPHMKADPEPTTLGKNFREAAKKYNDYPAIVNKDGKSISYTEYYNTSVKVAKSLISFGLQRKDCISVIGFNSEEYFFSLYGSWIADVCPAGIYTTNNPDACYYVLNHCNAQICVCQGGKQAAKIASLRERLPNLKAIVVYWPDEGVPDVLDIEGLAKVYTWDQFLTLGEGIEDNIIDDRINGCEPGTCATLIYTSGTTGEPKAVMLSHDNCTCNTSAMVPHLPLVDGDIMVSYLPLNHVAGQYVDVMLSSAVKLTIYIGTLVNTLHRAHPTIFMGVPRVFEKMMEAIKGNLAKKGSIVQFLMKHARETASKCCLSQQFGETKQSSIMMPLYNVLFKQIKKALGWDNVRVLYASAAPISVEVIKFFASFNLPIYDLLGQSEGTAPIALNLCNGIWKIGSCGQAVAVDEFRIDDNQELIYRGRNTMMDEEGWIHSGDMGRIDVNGFIFITGRLKELIVTAGGENIPPVYIEDIILSLCPYLSTVVVVGDKRKYLSCVLSLKTEMNASGDPTEKLASSVIEKGKELGSTATTTIEAEHDPLWADYIESIIQEYNTKKSISNAQHIRRWCFLEHDISVSRGELTATMKLRRNVVQEHYKTLIDSMYTE
ncbi:hypothetical protein WA158_004594 [Blastocystis sp. Blastoise]